MIPPCIVPMGIAGWWFKVFEHLVKWMVFNFGCAFWFAAVQYLDLFLCQLQRFSMIAMFGQGWPRDLSHSCAGD